MIGEKEVYHGAALARLVLNAGRTVSIESWGSVSRSAYVLEGRAGMYVKYSTKRLSPWIFEFTADHGVELNGLRDAFGTVWLVLVCGHVGIVTASWSDILNRAVSLRADGSFSLSASKKVGEKFRLSGSGKGPMRIAESAYPDELLLPKPLTQQPN